MDRLKTVLYIISAAIYGIIFTLLFSNIDLLNKQPVLGIVVVWLCLLLLADIGQFIFDIYDSK